MQAHLALRKKPASSFWIAVLKQYQCGHGSGQRTGLYYASHHLITCCALGLLAISTNRTENLASSMSCCAFLADTHHESKSKSLSCFIIHCSIQLSKQTDGSLLSGKRAKLPLLHRTFWHNHQYCRELHKTYGNSALSSRWFMFQTTHQSLGQNSQLLVKKKSRRFGKGNMSLGPWQ